MPGLACLLVTRFERMRVKGAQYRGLKTDYGLESLET